MFVLSVLVCDSDSINAAMMLNRDSISDAVVELLVCDPVSIVASVCYLSASRLLLN